MLLAFATAVALAAPAPDLPACDLDRPLEEGEIGLYLLTAAPGEQAFSTFGHAGLWFRHHRKNVDRVWQYGVVYSDRQNVATVLLGTLQTGWGIDPPSRELARYEADDRTVLAQRLDLPKPDYLRLLGGLQRIADTRKNTAAFDWATNNCSTGLRDLLNDVTQGDLETILRAEPGPMPMRAEARRTAPAWWAWVGIDLLAGRAVDQTHTQWEAGLLPERLADSLHTVSLEHPDGSVRPLVASECVLRQGARSWAPVQPPAVAGVFWALGLSGGVTLGALGALRRHRPARRLGGLLVSVWGLVLGVLGTTSLALAALSAWPVWDANLNWLLLHPLALALVPLGAAWARGREPRWGRGLVALVTALAALAVVVLPMGLQDSVRAVGLIAPSSLALAVWVLPWPLRSPAAAG